MATKVSPTQIGVDVGKDELVVSLDGERAKSIKNTKTAIKRWLKSIQGPVEVAMEATSVYHMTLAEEAYALGHTVFLVDGYKLKHYREGIGQRAKTDFTDARLLVRYLRNEREELRAWEPPPKAYRELQVLLRRRAVLVQNRSSLQQSFAGVASLKGCLKPIIKQIQALDVLIKKLIVQAARRVGWADDIKRCEGIEGVGPLVSAALNMAYHRGHFKNSDAFIAFIGMDVRPRDSGIKKGKRHLTKKGDPEIRRLLFLAAMKAKAKPAWQGYYQRCLERGLKPIQALNALARKIARVAFALIRNKSTYVPKNTCMQT